MSKISVTLVQTNLIWQNEAANFKHIENHLGNCITDLIVLPEMFSTGFSMQPEQFASIKGESVLVQLKQWSNKTNAAICGSAMVKVNTNFLNRFFWVEPNKDYSFYDKAHLFRMGEEQKHYSKGNNRILINYKDFVFAPFVCYDLRFPIWMRRTKEYNYDAVIIVANWPEQRSNHWKTLLQARAIENQSYVIAVNRVGTDGNGVAHVGDSMVISPLGEIFWHGYGTEMVQTVKIDLNVVKNYRESFPVELDNDNFKLI